MPHAALGRKDVDVKGVARFGTQHTAAKIWLLQGRFAHCEASQKCPPKICRRVCPRSTYSEAPFTQPPIQLQSKPTSQHAHSVSLFPPVSLSPPDI